MYLRSIRVVGAFLLQLRNWKESADNLSPHDRYVIHPEIRFLACGAGRASDRILQQGPKSWALRADVENVVFRFNLARTDIDKLLRGWELIGTNLLAFAVECREVLDEKLPGVLTRRDSEEHLLLDVKTAERLVMSHFRNVETEWLRDILLGYIRVNYESPSTKATERVCCIAVRAGRVFGGAWGNRTSPWLGFLVDLVFDSSHQPSSMTSEESVEFFEVMKEGVSEFGTQWAALAARQYLFGAISGDDHVSDPVSGRTEISLLINYNPFLSHLHRILFVLGFGATPNVYYVGPKGTDGDVPEGRRKDISAKFNFVVTKRNQVITAARQLERPGIRQNFMSPLKRGKLAFVASKLKIGTKNETFPRSADVTEEIAVEKDRRRWADALIEVDKVLNGHSAESETEHTTTESAVEDEVDSDTDSVADAEYDSDTDSDSGTQAAEVIPSAGEGSGGSTDGPALVP